MNLQNAIFHQQRQADKPAKHVIGVSKLKDTAFELARVSQLKHMCFELHILELDSCKATGLRLEPLACSVCNPMRRTILEKKKKEMDWLRPKTVRF